MLSWELNRLSAEASAESTARRDSETIVTSDRLIRSGPGSTATFDRLARTTSLFDCGSTSSTKPRSACGNASSRPSSRRGSTSSSESDVPMARLRPSTARSFASACWLSPSPAARGISSCDTITPSDSPSRITCPMPPVSAGMPADDRGRRRRAVAKTSRWPQTLISSPSSRRRRDASGSPLTRVPLRLWRSSTNAPSLVTVTAACWRLTAAASRTTVQPGWRPMTVRPSASGNRVTRRPEVRSSRNGTAAWTGWRAGQKRNGHTARRRRAKPELPTVATAGTLRAPIPMGNGVTVARLALNQLV